MADKTLLDLVMENPKGLGEAPPLAQQPKVFFDEYGQPYDEQGRRIETPAPDAPSLGESLLNIAESPARMVVGAVTEPISALQRLAENSVDENGNIAIPNPQNPENQQDVLTGLLSLYGGNALSPGRLLEGAAARAPEANLLAREMTPVPAGGFDVWHGSPHDFDKFDASKIGTGEGAQAYGHGLYFAENSGVAKDYQRSLAGHPQYTVDGAVVPEQSALYALSSAFGGGARGGVPVTQGLIDRAKEIHAARGGSASDFDNVKPGQNIGVYDPTGYLYQARVNANPEDFLHLDKRFGEQSPIVQDALTSILAERQPQLEIHPEYPVSGLMNVARMPPSEIAGALKDAGIPGIRYLDAGSRGAREGSHNYVLFSDDPVNVLHKWRGDQQLYSDTGKPSIPGVVVAGAEANTPVRAYHATNADFAKFDPSFTDEVGFHFGDKGTANNRAYIRSNGNPLKFFGYKNIPVEMDIQKAAELSSDVAPNFSGRPLATQLVQDGIAPQSLIDDLAEKSPAEQNTTVKNWLIDNGYDAVKYPNKFEGGGKPSYMALGTGNVRHAKTGDVLYAGSPPIPAQDDPDKPLSLADLALLAGQQ